MKKRIDTILVEKGYFNSREKAKAFIISGDILVNELRVDKASQKFDDEKINIRVKNIKEYVSRGAYKLLSIINKYNLDFKNKICIDIGASTGGFTEVLLEHGAKKVYAIDVGYNQLAYRLRQDERVKVKERTNARTFDFSSIRDADIYVGDVSFISLKKIFSNFIKDMKKNSKAFFLIKPQFEVGKEIADKFKGIITDSKIHQEVIDDMKLFLNTYPVEIIDIIASDIKGTKGNQEFIIYFIKL